jgi:hypothetical protein
MSEPKPMPRAEVEAAFARAGLKLSKAQLDELHGASGYIAEMIERIGRDRPKANEPAAVFKARQS